MTGERARRNGTVVMAGMPKTGKSTYLGALYHVLETESKESISLDVLPSARQHLEGLRGRWLRVEREGRTSSSSPVLTDLNLRTKEGGPVLSLHWPDLSGEYFDDMVRKRSLNGDVANILKEATAIVIFVHPDTVTQQPRIHAVNRLAEILEGETSAQGNAAARVGQSEPEIVAWDPMMIPGQILVVELMQLLLDNQLARSISGISVVLSAWDLVASNFQSPKEYVEKQLPLLHQFLEANAARFQFELFGVSALGGDPEEDRDRLNAEIDPVDRIQVVCEDGANAEDGILAPIRWLIE